MIEKRYAAVKKVNLSGLSEGWDEECFAFVVPASYEDNQKTLKLKVQDLDQEGQIDFQLKFVADHFISGKIKVFDGEDFALDDMSRDDLAASVAISDHLYSEIMGFDLDPKGMRKAVAENALRTTNESSTETTSYEDSPEE